MTEVAVLRLVSSVGDDADVGGWLKRFPKLRHPRPRKGAQRPKRVGDPCRNADEGAAIQTPLQVAPSVIGDCPAHNGGPASKAPA